MYVDTAQVVRVLEEPTAAAVAYDLHKKVAHIVQDISSILY